MNNLPNIDARLDAAETDLRADNATDRASAEASLRCSPWYSRLTESERAAVLDRFGPQAPHYRFEDRAAESNQVKHSLNMTWLVFDQDRKQALHEFDHEVKTHADSYTPDAGRRLVLLAVTR